MRHRLRRSSMDGRGGFSLLELLVAMSIFSLISVGIVTLLARTSEFMAAGNSKTETLDALQTFTQSFDRDFGGIQAMPDSDTGAPAVRLYSDVANCDVDGDGKADSPARRLFFVKLIRDEATSPLTRTAGTTVEAKQYTDQFDDSTESEKKQLKATGGLMEVFWTAVPESKQDLAVLTLYRGYRSPIGGPDSLLPSKAADDIRATPQEKGPLTLAEIKRRATPVMSGVLYFGTEFWGRRTESWDTMQAPPKGPFLTWDSTRGIMRRGNLKAGMTDGFHYAKDRTAQGGGSFADPTDDTYPRRLRVTLVVEEIGETRRVGQLLQRIEPDARSMVLADTTFIPAVDTTQQFVKIGAEWMQFDAADNGKVTGLRRGVRGTTPVAHDVGELVHYGRTMVREFAIATFRDAYRDELPAMVERK